MTSRTQRSTQSPRRRRGVLLLVVLSMLVLFLLMGLTFVVVGTSYKDASESFAKIERTGDSPRKELDSAMYQLVRDTTNPLSAIRGHSLLRDMYGNDGFRAQVNPDPVEVPGTERQFLELTLAGESKDIRGNDYVPQETFGYYNGCVLTFLTGLNKGISTRIVYHRGPKIRVMHPAGDGLRLSVPLSQANAPLPWVLINGRPFNGAGFAHDVVLETLTDQALLPNRIDVVSETLSQAEDLLYFNYFGYTSPEVSGPDESYDAPDYQNMALGAIIPDTGGVIPSFHRHSLYNYQRTNNPDDLEALRRSTLRTFYEDPDAGEEVDNDGDGYPDSVWVDLGFPRKTASDGRQYKPLYAFLCIDMDGKLNVNAHGNRWHCDGNTIQGEDLAGGVSTSQLAKGAGYGPPEINLGPPTGLFADEARYNFALDNRYGANLHAGNRYGANPQLGVPGVDLLSRIKFFEYPWKHFDINLPDSFSAFSSPPDLHGRLAFGLGKFGQPVYEQYLDPFPNLRENTPYALNLSARSPRGEQAPGVANQKRDQPFSVAELEGILRWADVDTRSLPDRLRQVLAITDTFNIATTDSFDLPVPNVLGKGFGGVNARHVTDFLRIQNNLSPEIRDRVISNLLAPELIRGERMDINRPFGNGRDERDDQGNYNYIVDEPAESGSEFVWQDVPPFQNTGQSIPFDSTNGTGEDARSLYARHLYVLMLSLIDVDLLNNEVKDAIAQWAINVVDFRDADSIMTRFMYDRQPFDGWTPNAEVWGCERPELLITETLAFHDRRSEDRDDEAVEDQNETPATTVPPDENTVPDEDFDQRLLPRGSFFVELYNPWIGDYHSPAEFYRDHAEGRWPDQHGNIGVQLDKQAPGGAPVWRLLIAKDVSTVNDLPEPRLQDIERSVYFTNPSGFSGLDDGESYHTTKGIARLLPGRYAVVGSKGILRTEQRYCSVVGRRRDADDATRQGIRYDTTQQIELKPDDNSNVNQVEIRNSSEVRPTNIDPAIAIVIDQPRSLSISEPLLGYKTDGLPDEIEWDPTAAGGEGAFTPPWDNPLDLAHPDIEPDILMTDGTESRFRNVYLQRLANPMKPFESNTNPYRTIDSMWVDLTTFNGVDDGKDPDAIPGDPSFATLERGDGSTRRNLWEHQENRDPNAGPLTGHVFNHALDHTLGYLNTKYKEATLMDPFPWLTWNNRPFISQFELMQVPRSASSQLLRDYTLFEPVDPYNPYTQAKPPFGHLLNFFHDSSQLYRLLDYVHVPSRFVGTETVLNPKFFVFPTTNPDITHGTMFFRPPFNRVSNFRDPGRVNINTIYSRRVWNAILNGHSGPTFDELIASRRGYDGIGIMATLPNWPTRFLNPFRAAGAGAGKLVPTPLPPRRDVECGLLRSKFAESTATPQQPLFEYDSVNPHNNSRRSPYFRYQTLQRLGNLVTTRSNVYAIWITVGYFEVDPNDPLSVVRELGSDIGEVRRHRAFYIVDRTIPVAFEPGKNHNVDEAIVLRRFIE